EGAVARVGETEILKQDYLEFLYLRLGKRPVEEFVADLLVEQEAEAYGIVLAPARLEEMAAERERSERETPQPGDFEQRLQREGKDLAMYRALIREELRREYLTGELVLATRVVTDERLQQEFEREYGLGGLKLLVRHVLLMPNVLRAERIRESGVKPSEIDIEALKAEARQLAQAALARLRGGADFAAVAAECSHDRVTREAGGELQNYNGRLYGPAFRQAVEALQPGGLSEVIETGAGFHVVQLVDRTETRLEGVRDALVKQILESEPSWQERSALVQALRAKAKIQLW
ncbi:MAG: peptidylprolyl isomerase, partial [Planctomycetes bacterium]|nr:peptidylprolyl isomerase [Planctomycetota bacterium]